MSIVRMDFAREAVAVLAVVGVYYGVVVFLGWTDKGHSSICIMLCFA